MEEIFKNVKGHFHLDVLDKNNNVIDEIDDHNMIMVDARKSMAEIFANLIGIKFAHKFIIGTMGNTDASLFIPKDEFTGFTKDRDRLFCMPTSKVHSIGDMLESIKMYDVIALQGETEIEYYRYNGANATNFVISEDLLISDLFKHLDGKPYYYEINFELPRVNNAPPDQNNNTDPESLDVISIEQKDTSVIFTFTMDLESGNEQYLDNPQFSDPSSLFNEACIIVNDRIFCMKTFNTKVKDDSVKFRIIWTITF